MNQQKVWDKIAESWAERRQKMPGEILDFLKNKTGKILDVGCGSGRNFLKKNNLEWFGVDFSSRMLGQAEKRAKTLNLEVHLIKSDISKLPFSDSFFDAVICYSVLHCLPSKYHRKTLKEIFRVLKPGKTALLSVWGKKSDRLKNKPKECFIPWTRGSKKYLRYTYIFDRNELKLLVQNIGFKILKEEENKNLNLILLKPDYSAAKH